MCYNNNYRLDNSSYFLEVFILNKNIVSIECRFSDEDAFKSENGISKVLEDVYDIKFSTDNDNNMLLSNFLESLYECEKENTNEISSGDTDKKSKSVSEDGRISINIVLTKNHAELIGIAFDFVKVLTSLSIGIIPDVNGINNVKSITKLIMNSVHINTGLDLCVVKIFNAIYKNPNKYTVSNENAEENESSENTVSNENNDRYISLETIKNFIKKEILESEEGETTCPFNRACKKEECCLKSKSEDSSLVINETNLESSLKNLEMNNVIEKNKYKENEYRIKPLISM